uniref:Sphingosine-1-phosphate lyase 1 n=1 Tax=Strigamia maritima TaxID=126957 RepID=T1J300_STRMM
MDLNMVNGNFTEWMKIAKFHIDEIRFSINDHFKSCEPLCVIASTTFITILVIWIWQFIFLQEQSLWIRTRNKFFKLARKLPMVKTQLAKEIKKARKLMNDDVQKQNEGCSFLQILPDKGWNKEEIIEKSKKSFMMGKVDWKKGKVSGAVYNYSDALNEITSLVYGMCAYTNPLHPDVFPGVRKMEAEVVRMTCNLFHGDSNSCGVMTCGGTESIILACKAYRDRAFDIGIKHPEILVPVTAHCAFDKAANLMRMKIKHVPVDPVTMKVDMKQYQRYITRNTCMLVGSAPQFPHGAIDPIEDISKARLGLKYKIPVHVDACLGGFLIPFMEEAGFPVVRFDFRLPAVTSISADTHKYGSAPKGSSVLMYRDESYRHYQFFVQPNWPGGIYASPSLPGSRAGGIIAACWAAMTFFGRDGYVKNCKKIIETANRIEKGLREMPDLKIIGKPEVSVIAFGSDKFNIYRLSDALHKRGWSLNALQFPSCIHLCVTFMHTADGVAEAFLNEVRDCTEIIMKDPTADAVGKAAIYGLSQTIPDRNIVSELAWTFLDSCYITSFDPETE